MRGVACLVLLAGLPFTASGQQSSEKNLADAAETYEDSDAYQIYGILLENVKDSFFVIQAETDSWPKATAAKMGIKGDATFRKSWGAVIDDFARQYQKPKLLINKLKMTASYELVAKGSITSIFKSEGGWDAFYKRYPSSGGYFSFSAVGFNRGKTRAIVEMNHSCGLLCGGGRPHFFEKIGGKWREVSVDAEVTVWAS